MVRHRGDTGLRWRHKGGFLVFGLVGLLVLALGHPASALELVAAGMLTPETISRPAAGSAYLDQYYIPDPGRTSGDFTQANVWAVPLGGGVPTAFATGLTFQPTGGLFLPDGPYWGANAGKYLTVGFVPAPGTVTGQLHIYEPDGSWTLFWESQGLMPKVPVIAPASFGGFGGQVIVADGGPLPYAIDPAGNRTAVATAPALPTSARFGLAFVPSGWGDVGGLLLTSNSSGNEILSIDPTGIEELFTTVPLAVGQMGLRHMAFGPDGFFPGFGELLFVSISGSTFGGGALGDVVAIKSNGAVVASLRAIAGIEKFDPRGLYFTAAGDLLVSDAADPIWRVTPADFLLIPEPCTAALLVAGLASIAVRRRRRQ